MGRDAPDKRTRLEEVTDLILRLADERQAIRPRDVEAIGVPRRYLTVLKDAGLLAQPARGIYVRSETERSERSSMADAAVLVPHGIICLLSALSFHNLTTQIPRQVWMAIRPKDWLPSPGRLPLRIVRFSGEAYTAGIGQHEVDGMTVRVYSPAKTVADCFKYRNKIGLDVALEALRDCWSQRLCSIDDLWRYSRVCRVQAVVRPYLETLV